MPIVYSTLTSSVKYTKYQPKEPGQPHNVGVKTVLIKGGTNVANRALHTPMGVATHVTAEELDFLKTDATFIKHMKNGFIRVSDAEVNPEKVAGDMTTRDKSAPLVPGDFQGGKGAKPSDVKDDESGKAKSPLHALKDKVTG